MIKLQQLAHALALWRYGNFHRAAQAQHLSQPAFSRSIRSLEEGLGVPFFDRQTTVVTPTLYGETLLKRAEIILAETDELEREIELLQGLEAGSLAVATGAYAAEISASRALGELMRQHPDAKIIAGGSDVRDQVARPRPGRAGGNSGPGTAPARSRTSRAMTPGRISRPASSA